MIATSSLDDRSNTALHEVRVALPSLAFSTRVLRAGSGVPVVLLHGNPDNAAEWRRVLRALDGAGACFAPDLPGFGECDEPPESFDYSPAAHERYLDELLATLGVNDRLVLVVHDIGGVVGIPWAAKHIDRIRGLVITNTVIFERFPWFPVARAWARTSMAGRARAEAGMWLLGKGGGALFRRVFGRNSPELPAEELSRMTREFALDPKSKRSSLRLFRKMVPPEFFAGADAAVRELIARVPVHVIWGQQDPYIPARYADAFPGAKREIIEGGGHWIPITNAEKVAAAVRAMIAARP